MIKSILSLNMLFPTNEVYDEIYNKLKTGQPLKSHYKDFVIKDNDIIYQPTEQIVVKKSDVQNVLNQLYKDDNIHLLGKGINNAYKYIQQYYINITKRAIAEFLKLQPSYQLTRPIKTKLSKPIIELAPNRRWQIDLLDVSNLSKYNKGYNYILNCVDVFSRFCWLRLLKSKFPKDIVKAMKTIFVEATIKPNIVQCDNGTEFFAEFQEYLQNEHVKQLFNDSYTPTQNAIVERCNKDIRKIINAFMMERNTNTYYDTIDQIQDAKNQTYNSSIHATPAEVWTADKKTTKRNLPKSLVESNPKLNAKLELLNRQINLSNQYKAKDTMFKANQCVRVKMSSIFVNVRKMIKQNQTKYIVVNYTPMMFTIDKVIISRKPINRNKYILSNNGFVLQDKNGKTKTFNSTDLLHCYEDNAINMSMDDALLLNGCERNANDIKYE